MGQGIIHSKEKLTFCEHIVIDFVKVIVPLWSIFSYRKAVVVMNYRQQRLIILHNVHPSIHSSKNSYPKSGYRSSSSNTGAQTPIFPGHISQVLLGDPEAFPGQRRDIVCHPSPWSAPWPSTSLMWLEYPPRGWPGGTRTKCPNNLNRPQYFLCKGAAALFRAAHRWLSFSPYS